MQFRLTFRAYTTYRAKRGMWRSPERPKGAERVRAVVSRCVILLRLFTLAKSFKRIALGMSCAAAPSTSAGACMLLRLTQPNTRRQLQPDVNALVSAVRVRHRDSTVNHTHPISRIASTGLRSRTAAITRVARVSARSSWSGRSTNLGPTSITALIIDLVTQAR
jgi:hypothetical protein